MDLTILENLCRFFGHHLELGLEILKRSKNNSNLIFLLLIDTLYENRKSHLSAFTYFSFILFVLFLQGYCTGINVSVSKM